MTHTIHPLAGQGFNLSIEDCFDLIQCLKNAKFTGKDIGTLNSLKTYNNIRKIRKNFFFSYNTYFLCFF